MKSTLLLCALLAAPLCSHAAPVADKSAASSAPPAMQAGHDDDDGHDHGDNVKGNEGSLVDYFWRRSDAAFHAGDYPRAIELHRAIVALDPSDTESYGVGAWLLWSLDKKDEADAFIAKGLKHNPDNSEMWNVAAQQYGLEKEFASERDAYAKSVSLAGKDADQMLRRRYAHASEHAGDLGGSAQIWRGLVADFPNEAVNKSNLARVEAELADKNKGDAKTMGFVGVGALVLLGCAAWRKRAQQTV